MKGKDTMKAGIWIPAMLLILATLGIIQAAEEKSPLVLYQEALYQEETEGNLDEAIGLYEQVLDEAAEVKHLAVRSLYQLGMCHLKKGEKDAAAEYFKQVVNEYPKQTSVVRKAEKQLGKIAPEKSTQNNQSHSKQITELALDDGKQAGKWSFSGGGHAVRFKAPGDHCILKAIRIYGSRYGEYEVPNEDFSVWLCNMDFSIIKEFQFPYSTFKKRGLAKWVNLKTEPTELPEKFILCVGFDPHKTKGIYLYHDAKASGHSFVGLPGSELEPFKDGDWLFRAVIEESDTSPPDHPLKNRPSIVWFKAKESSGINNPKDLLDAFNKKHPEKVETFRFRTETENGQLIGRICVGNEDGKDELVKMLQKHDKLELIKAVPSYTIVFRAKGSKQVNSSDLLNIFNENYPKGVDTYFYHTVTKNGNCEGSISTDTSTEKDKLVQMIQSNDKLELLQVLGGEDQGGLYDQATPAVWGTIGSMYGQTGAKAGMKQLYTNSNIHFVSSNFTCWSGGYGFFTNQNMEPVSGRVRLSGTTNPNQKHYDIMGNPLDTEIVPDERAGRSKYYHIYLNLPQTLAPGQFFIYSWAQNGSNQLQSAPFSEDKYVLKMQNHFGNHAVEVFYLVVPNDLKADYEEQPTDTKTVGDYTIYAWEKEVQPDDNHVVTVNLSKQKAFPEYKPLHQPINVNISHSPKSDKLSVQHAVIAIAEAAGIPYRWDKSAKLAEPQRRQFVKPLNVKGKTAAQALEELLGPVGLKYDIDAEGLYLYNPEKYQPPQSANTKPTQNNKPLELSTLPFFDGEMMRLKLSTPAGMDIGQMIWQCRTIEKDGVLYDRIESYMHIGVQNFQQYTAVDAKQNSFLPIRGITTNQMGTFEADYGKDTITLKSTVNGKEAVRNFDVSGAVYDNEQALYVIRSLPLEVGYEAEFNIFPVQSGSSAQCKIRVTDIQAVPCHAGEMECYAIKLAVYSGGIKALEHDLWISTDEHRWVVKYDSGQVIMELISAGKYDLDQPEQISEHGMTYGFEIPAGWQFIHSTMPGEYKVSVQMLPPELAVWAGLYGIEKTGLSVSVKEIAEGDIEILKGYFKNYTIRPESWTEQEINGADSASYIADYEDKGQQMVEYRTYIMADSLIYWFVFRVEKDLFETEKPVLDLIVKSFNPKAYNKIPMRSK